MYVFSFQTRQKCHDSALFSGMLRNIRWRNVWLIYDEKNLGIYSYSHSACDIINALNIKLYLVCFFLILVWSFAKMWRNLRDRSLFMGGGGVFFFPKIWLKLKAPPFKKPKFNVDPAFILQHFLFAPPLPGQLSSLNFQNSALLRIKLFWLKRTHCIVAW